MVSVPPEFDPYLTTFNLLLLEAVETATDQILVISRSHRATVYFVSGGHVKKKIPFEPEWAQGLVEHLETTRGLRSHAVGNTHILTWNVVDSPEGKTLSLTLRQKLKTSAMDITQPLSASRTAIPQ